MTGVQTCALPISGALPPVWTTPEGDLDIGTTGKRTEYVTKITYQNTNVGDRAIHMHSILGILVGSTVTINLQSDSTDAYTNCIAENTKVTSVDAPNKIITISKPIIGFIPHGIELTFAYTFTHNNLFILDNSLIDYQLDAFDPDATTGSKLTFFIPPNSGTLPPGITLTSSGKLTGFVDPIIEIGRAHV